MPKKPSKRQLLITSSRAEALQKTVTSRSRHNVFSAKNVSSTRREYFLVAVVILASLVFTTNGHTVHRPTKMEDFQSNSDVGRKLWDAKIRPCKDCQNVRQRISRPAEPESRRVINVMPENSLKTFYRFIKKLGRICGGLSYSKCSLLHQLNQHRRVFQGTDLTNKLKPAVSSSTELVNGENLKLSSLVSSDNKTSRNVFSRQKRLASGDRRLVYVFSKTKYVLQIEENGKVSGSPMKTQNGILEIQTVARNGIVRFFSPSSGYFLAMNEEGRLYGTKTYTKENCDFVERVQENIYTTYSSASLPKRKRRNHRYRRSTSSDAWYIGIGRKGQPRKASRISPRHNAALFLPLPL